MLHYVYVLTEFRLSKDADRHKPKINIWPKSINATHTITQVQFTLEITFLSAISVKEPSIDHEAPVDQSHYQIKEVEYSTATHVLRDQAMPTRSSLSTLHLLYY